MSYYWQKLVCVECGGTFEPSSRYGPNMRFCSAACKQRAYRKRKHGDESAATRHPLVTSSDRPLVTPLGLHGYSLRGPVWSSRAYSLVGFIGRDHRCVPS